MLEISTILEKFNIAHSQLVQSLPYWFCMFSTAVLSGFNICFMIQSFRIGIETNLQPYGAGIQLWWFCAIMIFICAIVPIMGILFLIQKFCPTFANALLTHLSSNIAQKISISFIAINILSIIFTMIFSIMLFCKGYIK